MAGAIIAGAMEAVEAVELVSVVAVVAVVEDKTEQITAFPIAAHTVMLASFAVIARCPACSQLFPVVGNSRSPCPFCAVQLEIVISRVSANSERDEVEAWKKVVAGAGGDDVEALAKLAGDDDAAVPDFETWKKNRPQVVEPEELSLSFLGTMREVLVRPRRFFRELGEADLKEPIGFAVAVYLPAVAIHALFLYLLQTNPRLQVFIFQSATLQQNPELFFALVPATAVLFIAYLATFYQAMSAIASKSRPELARTIRGTCFGLAPMVLAIVPLVGLFVGLAWTLVIHAIALRELHGLGRIRAALAVTLPLVVIALRFVYS